MSTRWIHILSALICCQQIDWSLIHSYTYFVGLFFYASSISCAIIRNLRISTEHFSFVNVSIITQQFFPRQKKNNTKSTISKILKISIFDICLKIAFSWLLLHLLLLTFCIKIESLRANHPWKEKIAAKSFQFEDVQ